MAMDDAELRDLGWDPVEPSQYVLGYVDPMPEDERPEGEDPRGIQLRRHPEMLIRQHPELAGVLDRWRTGARRAISAKDWWTLSSWEIDCVLIMGGAFERERERELEAIRAGTKEALEEEQRAALEQARSAIAQRRRS